MNYKKQLQKNGLTEKELTPKIKGLIKDFNEAIEQLNEMKDDIKNENWEDEDQKEEMIKAQDEMEADISEIDNEIAEKINVYAKSKAKRQSQSNSTPATEPTSAGSNEKPKAPEGVTTQKPPAATENNEPKDGKKKSNGLLWWVLGGAAVVLTFGVFNPFGQDE
jgi:peptidoglycan hydrolase CwlO-like protein